MSEVARIRQQIEAECEALKLMMHGFAITASHEVIRNRYRNLDRSCEELAKIVGESEATEIAVGKYVEIIFQYP